mgnify:CR=1 FL=1
MAGSLAGTGSELAHVVPRPDKDLFGSNYLNIAGGDFDFTKQFLPEVYEKEVERYGNRTVSGFLRMVGAEMPMASDEVVWSEQGRIHVAFTDVHMKTKADSIFTIQGTSANTTLGIPVSTGANNAALLNVGDTVVFHRYDGLQIALDEYKNHRLIPSNCIIGKLEKINGRSRENRGIRRLG